jgi:hypothetical protein
VTELSQYPSGGSRRRRILVERHLAGDGASGLGPGQDCDGKARLPFAALVKQSYDLAACHAAIKRFDRCSPADLLQFGEGRTSLEEVADAYVIHDNKS